MNCPVATVPPSDQRLSIASVMSCRPVDRTPAPVTFTRTVGVSTMVDTPLLVTTPSKTVDDDGIWPMLAESRDPADFVLAPIEAAVTAEILDPAPRLNNRERRPLQCQF